MFLLISDNHALSRCTLWGACLFLFIFRLPCKVNFKRYYHFQHDSGALHVDQDAIHQRIAELESVTKCTKYAKQKAGLKTELEAFLACLTDKKNLDNASPADVRMFLAHKDLHGKTQIHSMTCAFRGRHGSFSCGCPFRRSYGSLDSLVGQLRAIFRDHGRDREWNDIFGCGNPVASCIIRGYLSSARLEQSSAGVSPKQSAPLFADKLTMISRHISYRLSNPNLVKQEKFILHRDRAFLQILGQTGDRAGDLANLLSDQIFWLPEKEGLFFCLHKGKTVSLEDPRTVIIMQSQALDFCPVNSLLSYIALCKDLDLDLKTGYLFRAWDTSCNTISDKPFSSAAVNARLKSYLQRLHIWDGETPHGTRSGVALTLSWLGFGVDAIKNHVGWKTDKMYRHYTKDHDWK